MAIHKTVYSNSSNQVIENAERALRYFTGIGTMSAEKSSERKSAANREAAERTIKKAIRSRLTRITVTPNKSRRGYLCRRLVGGSAAAGGVDSFDGVIVGRSGRDVGVGVSQRRNRRRVNWRCPLVA